MRRSHDGRTDVQAMREELMRSFYRKNRGAFWLTAVCLTLLAGFNLLISWMLQRITDLSMGRDAQPVIAMALGSLAALLAFGAIGMVRRASGSRFLYRAMSQYRDMAFDAISRKGMASFDSENTATYLSALTNDAASVETGLALSAFNLIIQTVTLVGALAMMIAYSPMLTAAGLLLTALPVTVSLLCGGRMARAEQAVSDENERFVATVKDILSGFAVVKSFKAEREIAALFGERNRRLERAKYERKMTQDLIRLISEAASIVAQLGVFLLGAYMAVMGRGITPGVVVVFVQLMGLAVEPVRTLPELLAQRRAAQALLDKLARAACGSRQAQGREVESVLRQGIRLEHVSFGYGPEKRALDDVTILFERGKSYAVVGGSGSGKSTLLALLMGGYDGYEGRIAFDENELREISRDSLYDLVSIIQQNVFVFSSTLRENITMFKDFPQEDVDRAIERAGLLPLIREKGEGYLCGENGRGLSGGERQRVAIARSLLRETPVLLVDEATSALDAQTAYEVTSAILGIENLTRIVVTHRLEESLMKRYDEIIVLRGGRIAERGTYDALMAQKGTFYSLSMLEG
ncbi:MAG: ABC transporter ATP-binding protein [Clostridia bacterium]|nr:ABC transporter ATP-binding protein [Clostridia bacterium]